MSFAEDLANHLRPLLPRDNWTYQGEERGGGGQGESALELRTPGPN